MRRISNRPAVQARPLVWSLSLWLCFIAIALVGFAADKSGVSPTSISLPSGPGSIEGLGSEFEPNLNVGTAGYSVPITLPAGTAGNTPSLSVVYEGGSGNSPLGIGWSLSMPSVRRQCDKGIPHYDPNGKDDDFDGFTDEPDEQDRFLDPAGQELVLMDSGIYYPETQEQFIRWKHVTNGGDDYWEGHLPNGAVAVYGFSSDARVSDEERIFQWLLEKQTDPNGNAIEFLYAAFDGSEGQKYLEEIRYGPGASPWAAFYFARLTYEDRPDVLDDYRSGFLIRTGKRLAQIDVALQGFTPTGHQVGDINADGTPDALIRSYRLDYEADPYWSLLSKVTLYGADGVSALPPAVFGYPNQEPPRLVSAADSVVLSRDEPIKVMDNELVDLADLNADGLPDIFRTELSGRHTVHLNEGIRELGEAFYIQWGVPLEMDAEDSSGEALNRNLADSQVSLSDMDGDGLADLVFHSSVAGRPIYYRNKGTLGWGSRESMAVGDFMPPAPFAHAEVRSFDVDFDKRMDVVKTIATGYQVWYNLGVGEDGDVRYSSRVLTPGAIHENTVIVFGDEFGSPVPGVQLADLNGDRVTDVARIRPTKVIFCASLGYGQYAESLEIAIPPDNGFEGEPGFSYLTGEQIDRASLSDITGDGLADLVVERAGFRQLWYWINRGNGTFDERRFITQLPSNFTTLEPAVRWADMNGNGTSDLVYCDSGLGDGWRLRIVDVGLLINGSAETNLLTSIENGIGMKTVIEYRPSTAYAIDDLFAGQPWTKTMPNPASLISRVTIQDGLGHDYVSEFHYHEGYYHGVEREFRGFIRAERMEIGDESQPTLVTEYTFDVGETEEALKGKALRVVTKTEGGDVFSEEENTWETRELFSIIPPPIDPLEPDDVLFPHLISTTRTIREEPSGATQAAVLQSEYAFDDYGNQVMAADYGRVENTNLNAGNDERITWTVYSATPESPVWNAPVETVTTDNSDPPRIVSHTRNYYDGNAFIGLPFGGVTRGNLMRVHQWVGPWNVPSPPDPLPDLEPRYLNVSKNSDRTLSLSVIDSSSAPVSPGQDHWIDTQRSQYDSYGNAIGSADPLAQISDSSPDYAVGHLRQFDYDSALHTFPVREKIYTGKAEALEFQAAYDLAGGAVTCSTDANGNRTGYLYDSFIRLTGIVRPGGSPPDTGSMPTVAYHYVLASPVTISSGSGVINWIETQSHEQFGDSEAYWVSRTYQDGIGRTVMEKGEANDPSRAIVSKTSIFNKRRKPYQSLLPFYSTSGMGFEDIDSPSWKGLWVIEGQENELGLADAPFSETFYDATGRTRQVVNTDGTFARTEYFPLTRIESDEEDTNPSSGHYATPKVFYDDGLGRRVGVDEVVRLNDDGTAAQDLVRWHTRYDYDLLDNLTKITDSQRNEKIIKYDALGRKVYMDDPNRGRVWFVYDDASNIIESIDSKGQRSTCTYDGVNRILTEDYQDEGQPFSAGFIYDPSQPLSLSNRPDAVFFYDDPLPPDPFDNGFSVAMSNTQSMLAHVLDLAGEEHLCYDRRGNISGTVKRIADPKTGWMTSYHFKTEYDALNRPSRLTYPDGDSIEYLYGNRGLLAQVKGGEGANRNGNPFIVDGLEYTPFGQVQTCLYGNGISTEKRFDRRNRLIDLTTSRSDSPGSPLIDYQYTMNGVSNITRIDDKRSGSVCPLGDKRRNTQIFTYDDLYRLTRVQYSFALPGQADQNDGRIDYRYDRIGNMLYKSSPSGQGHIDHQEQGHSVVNLGSMTIGGALGAWGRSGRAAGDPAGPHALTSAEGDREFTYDANGNMTEVDGLACTYDFRDNLVSVEKEGMRVEYTYDYTGRRIFKKIWDATGSSASSESPSETTVYIGKHYEIREHGQPMKYVWNGTNRIARITGTLQDSALRIQRIPVHPGWNLLSLVVQSATAARQIADQVGDSSFTIYLSGANPGEYQLLTSSDLLPAGVPFWLQSAEDRVLEVQGAYTEPADVALPSGTSVFAWSGLEMLSLQDALPDEMEQSWFYDSEEGSWRGCLSGERGFVSINPPEFLSPGDVLFVQVSAEAELDLPPSSHQILYYHQDHLESTSLLCDAEGNVIEESVYYPFGYPRYERRAQEASQTLTGHYNFSQKEQDAETGLQYFESRYLAAQLCRFTSVDPVALNLSEDTLSDPQNLDAYGYARKNPLLFRDMNGEAAEILGVDAGTFAAGVGLAGLKGGFVQSIKGGPVKGFYIGAGLDALESVGEKLVEHGLKEAGMGVVGANVLGELVSNVATGLIDQGIDLATCKYGNWKVKSELGIVVKNAALGAASGTACGFLYQNYEGSDMEAALIAGVIDVAVTEGGGWALDKLWDKLSKKKEQAGGAERQPSVSGAEKGISPGGEAGPKTRPRSDAITSPETRPRSNAVSWKQPKTRPRSNAVTSK